MKFLHFDKAVKIKTKKVKRPLYKKNKHYLHPLNHRIMVK